jgi:hypothetical protein
MLPMTTLRNAPAFSTILCASLLGLFAADLAERQAIAADPTTADCLAASETSLALRNQHKRRAERSQLLVCAAATCPSDIRKECLRRVDEVNAAIPTVIFEVKDAAGNDLSAVRLSMDGEVLAESLQGTALSIDPGVHTFVFETPNHAPLQKQFVIREAEKERRESIRFQDVAPPVQDIAPARAAVVVPAQTASPAPAAAPPPSDTTPGLGTPRTIALAAGGVGILSLGVGTVFAVTTIANRNDAAAACPAVTCGTQRGVDLWNDAKTNGNLSTAFLIVGGLGLATGAILWFATRPEHGSVRMGVGQGSLHLEGTWE